LGVSSTLNVELAELYEKVWQFTLRKLAVEYGISDVGLAKVCRKLETLDLRRKDTGGGQASALKVEGTCMGTRKLLARR